jgi:peptidoglycan/LPS O-acetylase OafA/YrhL
MAKNKRYHSIDTLRGIAAVAICFFHFSNGNPALLPDGNWLKGLANIGFLRVEVFFVISGMVIAYTMAKSNYQIGQLGSFLLKRLARLEPPYLASIALVLGLNLLSSLLPAYSGNGFSFDAAQFFLHIGYLVPFWDIPWLSPVYWSLGIEFQFYLMMALTFPLMFAKRKQFFYLAFAISSFLFFITAQEYLLFKYVLFFFIGFLLFMYVEGSLDKRIAISLIILSGGFILLKDGWELAMAGLFPVLFMLFLGHKRFRVLEFLGKISYSLYLIHVPVGGRVINLTVKLTDNIYLSMLAVLAALLVSVAFAWLFFHLVEEPSIRWAKRIGYKPKQEPVLQA